MDSCVDKENFSNYHNDENLELFSWKMYKIWDGQRGTKENICNKENEPESQEEKRMKESSSTWSRRLSSGVLNCTVEEKLRDIYLKMFMIDVHQMMNVFHTD